MTPKEILLQIPEDHRRTPITVAQWENEIAELETYIASDTPRAPWSDGRSRNSIFRFKQAIAIMQETWPWLTREVIDAGHAFTQSGDCHEKL